MYIYLDESGDTGFKFHRGSSRYFIIGLIMVADPVPLHQAIDNLRLRLGLPEDHEFKFARTHHEGRVAFFEALRPSPYQVRCLVVDKSRLTSASLRIKERFYNYLVKLVLEHDFGTITNARLVIDESFKDKAKKMHLTTYLRRHLNVDTGSGARKITGIAYHESHRDNMLQAADMVVGAIARSYEKGDRQYHQLIRKKIQDEWIFSDR